jgi:hypothetical protein
MAIPKRRIIAAVSSAASVSSFKIKEHSSNPTVFNQNHRLHMQVVQ